MPVWSIIIAMVMLIAYAIKLAVIGGDEHLGDADVRSFHLIDRLSSIVSVYVIALCLVNLVSVVIQCGFGQCHTFNYQLLQ